MAMALAMLPTLAQGSRQVITTSDGKQYCLTSSQPDVQWEQRGDIWHPIHKVPQKAESTEGTVTVTYEWDLGNNTDVYPDDIFQSLNNSGTYHMLQFDNTEQLLPGEYDFLATAEKYESGIICIKYAIIKENISISKDTTIIFKLDDATNKIQIDDKHPNGQTLALNDNYNAVTINNGLCRKKDGGNFQILNVVTFTIPHETYINNVSNCYDFFQGSIYSTEDFHQPNSEIYITFHKTDDVTQPIFGDADSYTCVNENYCPSKKGKEFETAGFGGGLSIMYDDKEIVNFQFGSFTDSSDRNATLFINTPIINQEQLGLYALPKISLYDYVELIEQEIELPWGETFTYLDINVYETVCPYMTIQDNEPHYMHLGLNDTNLWFLDGQQAKIPYWHGPHPFYYAQSQKKQLFGSSVPILVYYNSPELGTSGFFLGRYGEHRIVDSGYVGKGGQTSLTLYEDGEEIWSGRMLDTSQNSIYQQATGIIEGVYDNQNIIVDGLQGQNLTTIHYDASIERDIAPTLTFLWFKDVAGDVNDRLQNASNGILEFSAGDFVPHYNAETYGTWLSCQALSGVQVSYSPYQEDTWSELAVEEVPENFCSPGYGYFYRGSLAGVTGEALNGWFDLKVKLTDAAGNWQEQVISPAFRIDDLAYSNVANIGSDNAREVARYSIDGKRVDASHHGVTIIRMSDGTARKVLN